MLSKIKYYILLIAFFIIAFSMLIFKKGDLKTYIPFSSTTSVNGTIEVHYLDVGQGDSILIKCGNEAMLIDAGGEGKATFIRNYLLKHNVTSLEYLVLTHPDADHIDAAASLISNMPVAKVLMPDIENDTQTYNNVMNELHYKSMSPITPSAGDILKVGEASATVLGPVKAYDDTNNSSIVIKLVYGSNTFLFTGDCKKEAEEDMVSSYGTLLKSDVYKAGHHGSSTSTSDEFLSAISPSYCVISCGADNPYGHPDSEIINKLQKNNINVFRTDKQGTIVATGNGKDISFTCVPYDSSFVADETHNDTADNTIQSSSSDIIDADKQTTFICNTNTKKIHLPDCESINEMSDHNKAEIISSINELINEGYSKCGRCLKDIP